MKIEYGQPHVVEAIKSDKVFVVFRKHCSHCALPMPTENIHGHLELMHTEDFSPVCVPMWSPRGKDFVEDFPQSW